MLLPKIHQYQVKAKQSIPFHPVQAIQRLLDKHSGEAPISNLCRTNALSHIQS